MASSSTGSEKGNDAMEPLEVPQALRKRLGDDGTAALLELGRAWSDHVLNDAVDRFERRLTQETASLRTAMATGFAQVRQEMTECEGRLRQEIVECKGSVRQEIAETAGSLRQEIAETRGVLRVELANGRAELLKWAFLFWVGQAATVAGLMALMLRATGR